MAAHRFMPAWIVVAATLASPAGLGDVATSSDAVLPEPLVGTSAVWTGGEAYIFGGKPGTVVRFDPVEETATVVNHLPQKRTGVASAWDGDDAYVLGGVYRHSGGHLQDVDEILRYSPQDNQIEKLSARLPTPRLAATAVWTGDEVYVFGGMFRSAPESGGVFLDDILAFDPSSGTVERKLSTLPSGRLGTSAVWSGSHVYLFGGVDWEGRSDQILRYDPGLDRIDTLDASLPSPRASTSAAWNGTCAFIFGGQSSSGSMSDVVRFCPDRPEPVATMPAVLPSPRQSTSAVWADSMGYVFGGQERASVPLDSIVKYNASDQPPAAALSFGPPAPSRVDDIRFTDRSIDVDGTITARRWDFSDGTTSTDANPTHRYTALGEYNARLTVWDDKGQTSSAERTVHIRNLPPVPGFSLDSVEPRADVPLTFRDLSVDPDGGMASWHWDFGDGATSTQRHPTHTYDRAGAYTVRLVVTDGDGESAQTTKNLEVAPPSGRPAAAFSHEPHDARVGSPVRFTDATRHSADLVSWQWDLGDGNTSSGPSAGHTYYRPGVFLVRLTVEDTEGRTSTVTREVAVSLRGSEPPIASFETVPRHPTSVDAVRFVDRSAPAEAEIVEWEWDFGDGTSSERREPIHRFEDPGIYVVRLRVEDTTGAAATNESIVAVRPAVTEPPVAGFDSTSEPGRRSLVRFQDLSRDPDGRIANWHWDFGDGNASEEYEPVHRYQRPGTYLVALFVTDDLGATAVTEKDVVVPGQAPTAVFHVEDAAAGVGVQVPFEDASHDPDGHITDWHWDFGDGSASPEPAPIHAYGASGTYRVTLTVTDDDGFTAGHNQTVRVDGSLGFHGDSTDVPATPAAVAVIIVTVAALLSRKGGGQEESQK